MRRLPAAILVSVIGHAAAFAWGVRGGDVVPVPPRAASPVVTAPAPPAHPAPAVEPLSVVLFDEPSVPPPPAGTVAAERAPSRAAISTGAVHDRREPRGTPVRSSDEAGARGNDPPSGDPVRSSWMTMRAPERPALTGPSPEFLGDFLARSRPVPPPPDIPGERIADEIAEVRQQLRHARRYSPDQVGALRMKLVDLNAERAAEELRPAGGGTYRADKETFTARIDPDGKVHMKDKPSRLDTQDRMMLRMGIDPYARNKLAFLDRTRDQRVAVGERYTRALLSRSAELMQQNIDRLWATASALAARKAGLFELWDDCAETGSDALVAGGAAARTLVIGVIRARLRGDEAYTSAELAGFNARRRSTAEFAPYE